MISSICWLPRGAAKPVPAPAALTQEELGIMRQEAADMAAGVLQVGSGIGSLAVYMTSFSLCTSFTSHHVAGF